jgi:hypothetical protein
MATDDYAAGVAKLKKKMSSGGKEGLAKNLRDTAGATAYVSDKVPRYKSPSAGTNPNNPANPNPSEYYKKKRLSKRGR